MGYTDSGFQGQNKWKDKYLASLQDIESLEGKLDQRVDILRRGLVRVSLAADGVDPDLDVLLGRLRAILRNAFEYQSIANTVESIENAVLRMDKQRAADFEGVHATFEKLIDGLMALEPQHLSKSQLKRFQNSAHKRLKAREPIQKILRDFVPVFVTIIEQECVRLAKANAEKKSIFAGLFSIFPSSQELSSKDKEASNLKAANKKPDAKEAVKREVKRNVKQDELSLDETDASHPSGSNAKEALSSKEIESEVSEEAPCTPENLDDSVGEMERVIERVSGVLLNLIDNIETPANANEKVESLLLAIDSGLEWKSLPQVLSDVASLVTLSTITLQKEAEGFLLALNDHLSDIYTFVKKTEDSAVARSEANDSLDSSIRSHIGDIREDIAASKDLDEMRSVIEVQLVNIVSEMDKFNKGSDGERQEFMTEIESLHERMTVLEGGALHLSEALAEQKRKALNDSLTEIPNRHAYEERIKLEFDRWQRNAQPLSVAMADVDFFKKVNDDFGHLAGDKVLKVIAGKLLKGIRKTDFVARFGGEEFVFIFPETNSESVVSILDDVRKVISESAFHFRGKPVQITVSFGVSTFSGSESIKQTIMHADNALYKAKDEGRNRVEKYIEH